MNETQLRRFVRKVIRERLSCKRKKLSLAEMLFEQEAPADKGNEKIDAQAEKSGDFKAVTTMTNIKDLDGADAYNQLVSGDEEAPLIQAMMTTTGWASGAISKAGGTPAIKKWAEDTGEGELTARISHIAGELPGGAPAKQDMPALEGGDANAVADALSPGGDFTIDLGGDYAAGKEDFDEWYKSISDEERAAFEAGEIPGQEEAKKEGVTSLNSALFEDKYPRDGMGPLKGAPNKGESGDPANRQELTSQALAFLTKGQVDGNKTDDAINVTVGGTLANSAMIPTQSNILAGKSLLFAFLQAVGASDLSDMGGAFVTSNNEILDGHHRWSGAYIGTGGGLTHSNVHIVDGDADTLVPMLVSVGNALGRPQKGVEEEEKKESVRSSHTNDDLVMERWQRLAGLLKG
jgi:hypothetical protein